MRIDRASITVRASPERVFNAFIDREAILRWLPPDGATANLEAFDARPGGAFRMTLVFDDANAPHGKTSKNSDTVDGRFVELESPRSIVQEIDFVSDDPGFAGTMTMRWTLDDTADGTRVSVAASNVPAGIKATDHQAGLASSLAHLAACVEGR